MAVNESDIAEQRYLLRQLLRRANRDIMSIWNHATGDDRELLFELLRLGLPEVVSAYRAVAVDLGVGFYEDSQGLAVSIDTATAVSEINQEKLEASLRWAIFGVREGPSLGAVAGITQQFVVDGFRDVGIAAADSVGETWVRAAHPGACNFCRLLATRGLSETGGYTSAEAASYVGGGGRTRGGPRAAGEAFHDNCMCLPVLYSEYKPPSYVKQWEEDYFAAYDSVGGSDLNAVLAEMRSISGHNH